MATKKKAKKKKSTKKVQYEGKRGRSKASPKFLESGIIRANRLVRLDLSRLSTRLGIRFSFSGHKLRYAQKSQCMPVFASNTPAAIPWAAACTRR
jgi:hypothetical protein